MVHFISKLLEFLCSRVSYSIILLHTPSFSSIPHFPTATPPPIQGMSRDLSASAAPRGGAFVLANMTNPHLFPPSPVGGVVGHNIDMRIRWVWSVGGFLALLVSECPGLLIEYCSDKYWQ